MEAHLVNEGASKLLHASREVKDRLARHVVVNLLRYGERELEILNVLTAHLAIAGLGDNQLVARKVDVGGAQGGMRDHAAQAPAKLLAALWAPRVILVAERLHPNATLRVGSGDDLSYLAEAARQ
jgi:hypothetical protein